jgi:hypothetical protein
VPQLKLAMAKAKKIQQVKGQRSITSFFASQQATASQGSAEHPNAAQPAATQTTNKAQSSHQQAAPHPTLVQDPADLLQATGLRTAYAHSLPHHAAMCHCSPHACATIPDSSTINMKKYVLSRA